MRPAFKPEEIKTLPFEEFTTCVQVNQDICSHDYRLRFTENTVDTLKECVLVCLEAVDPSKVSEFVFPTEGVDAMKAISLPILEAYMKLKNIEPKLCNDM